MTAFQQALFDTPLPPNVKRCQPRLSSPHGWVCDQFDSTQAQSFDFDVASPFNNEVQAPRDSVKSTANALVKVDSNFLPGTTIRATHWVAYAMTKGRIRVISRSSGDRTLLQLPQVFAPSTSVVETAVFGNRLAGVTSDGGFVVWGLPEVVTGDVPGRVLLRALPSTGPSAVRSVNQIPLHWSLILTSTS